MAVFNVSHAPRTRYIVCDARPPYHGIILVETARAHCASTLISLILVCASIAGADPIPYTHILTPCIPIPADCLLCMVSSRNILILEGIPACFPCIPWPAGWNMPAIPMPYLLVLVVGAEPLLPG